MKLASKRRVGKGDLLMMLALCRTRLAGIACAHVVVGGLALASASTGFAQSTMTPQLGIAPAAEPQGSAAAAEPPAVAAQPQSQAAQPDVPQRPQAGRQGLFAAIGQWIDDSIGTVASGFNNNGSAAKPGGESPAADPAKGGGEPAKDGATGLIRIPTGIVTGRQHCIRAANGGPDCLAASDALCRSKGYAGGTSLHIQSEQKCPVWGWIAGEKPVGKCGTETFVTSAVCR